MDPAPLRRIREEGGWFPVGSRTLVQVSGPDARRYLNGQLTIDVNRLKPRIARAACLLNAKGKIIAPVFIQVTEEGGYLIEGPIELHDEIMARLERYIIADDVTLTDRSGPSMDVHVIGREAPRNGISIVRIGRPGFDVAVAPPDLPEITAGNREILRIEARHPLWGREMDSDTLVQEARLEERSVDFDKGCYVGQEVVSRLKSVGRVNRRIHVFESAAAPAVLPLNLHADSASGPVAGHLTSIARDFELARTVALGYLHRTFEEGTAFVAVDPAGQPVGSFDKRPS